MPHVVSRALKLASTISSEPGLVGAVPVLSEALANADQDGRRGKTLQGTCGQYGRCLGLLSVVAVAPRSVLDKAASLISACFSNDR
jgi:hypothetical protein